MNKTADINSSISGRVEEKELVRFHFSRSKQGNSQSTEWLLKHVEKLINSEVRNFRIFGQESDDLVSIVTLKLLENMHNHNPEVGDFEAFARKCVHNSLIDLYRVTKYRQLLFAESYELLADEAFQQVDDFDPMPVYLVKKGTMKELVNVAGLNIIEARILLLLRQGHDMPAIKAHLVASNECSKRTVVRKFASLKKKLLNLHKHEMKDRSK